CKLCFQAIAEPTQPPDRGFQSILAWRSDLARQWRKWRIGLHRRSALVTGHLDCKFLLQALEIYRHSRHHQVHAIGSLRKALIDISECISVDSPERISRDNAKTNLVGDHDKRFV